MAESGVLHEPLPRPGAEGRPMLRRPRKAVILVDFGPGLDGDGGAGAAQAVPDRGRVQAARVQAARVQAAVEEALDAGLTELIFVTQDSMAMLRNRLGQAASARPRQIVVARQGAAGGPGQALSGIRHLIGEETFVVMIPADFHPSGSRGAAARLIAVHGRLGGNLAAVSDDGVLSREGAFAAISADAAGCYVLQPAILEALDDNPQGGLAAAILATAEAWPATAIPLTYSSDAEPPAE